MDRQAGTQLRQLDLEDEVLTAPRKALFVAADPHTMVARHALRSRAPGAMMDSAAHIARTDYRYD